jgi:recombination protein RecT
MEHMKSEKTPETTENQLAKPPPAPSAVAKWLAENEQKLAEVLPSVVTPKRFARVALTVYNKNPKLAECAGASIIECLLSCAQIGLEPDDARGLAYLIPYDKKCTLVIGYKGLAMLAFRSGAVKNIEPRIVREFDDFGLRYGTTSQIHHVPRLKDAGKAIAVYCVVTLNDGSKQFEVMTVEEVDAIKVRSSGWQAFVKKYIRTTPWETDWEEMAKKTVFKRLAKYLPLSNEFQEAVAIDNHYELEREETTGGFEVKKPVMSGSFLRPEVPAAPDEKKADASTVTIEDVQKAFDDAKAAREAAEKAQPSTENLNDKPDIKF